MYVVRDKKTKEVLHVNPAPLSQALEPKEVYARFDPKKMEIGRTDGPLPERFDIRAEGEIVQSVPEGGSEREKGSQAPEERLERKLQSLRGEVTAFFRRHKTPGGYRLDDLARQKASFSFQFRHLPGTDDRKKELLEAGLIYPDDVLDEILAEVQKIQAAYRAAKNAVETAVEQDEPVEQWASISLEDHLPGASH